MSMSLYQGFLPAGEGGERCRKQRLLSLDVLRGLTVAAMILVNNGGGREHFEMLKHSAWNGLTPCDLVFPFFLFMVGVSVSLARPTLAKVLRRTFMLFAVGVALHAWDAWVRGDDDIFTGLRITGVLQRIALCYGIVSLTMLRVPARHLLKIAVLLLGLYAVILLAFDGYAPDAGNFANAVDRAVFGAGHLYRKGPIDPEGLPGLVPSVAHTMIGVVFGQMVLGKEALERRLLAIFSSSFVLILVAYFLSYGLPFNKRVWSPSYVLVTCGLAAGLLALLTIIVDCKGHDRWCLLFQMFGMNAFALYIVSEMLPAVFGRCGVYDTVWTAISAIVPSPCWASLAYALFIDAIMALVAWVLWRNRTFIKI